MSLVKNKDKDAALKEGPAADYAKEAEEAFKRDQARNKEILGARESYKMRAEMQRRNQMDLERRKRESEYRQSQRRAALKAAAPKLASKSSIVIGGDQKGESSAAKKA